MYDASIVLKITKFSGPLLSQFGFLPGACSPITHHRPTSFRFLTLSTVTSHRPPVATIPDHTVGSVWYQEMEHIRAFDVATIDCVIGQVKVGKRWGIIDHSYGSQRVAMQGMWEPKYESEDPND